MTTESIIIIGAGGVVVVNIAAFRYLGIFGLLVTLGSCGVVERLLNIAEKLK